MSNRTPYTYTILRYRHDVVSGECVNVGVVLHAPERGFLKTKVSLRYGRLRKIFPDLDPEAFKSSLRAIERGLKSVARRERGDMLSKLVNAETISSGVLRRDDSSFAWSEIGSGISNDPESELEKLFERFVTWYDHDTPSKRTDEEVWKPVRDKLAAKNLANRLKKKVVKSDLTSVEFDHTWKNGALHCYQPLSFDLASKDGIQEKVARWSGYLYHLESAQEDFRTYFIVGGPSDPALRTAYSAAIKALKASPRNPEVYEEAKIDELVDLIEDEMRAHDAQT